MRKLFNIRFLLIALIAIFSINLSLFSSDSVQISPLKDNTLYEDSQGTLSNGTGDFFFAGNTNTSAVRRGLIAFDIAANVPAGSVIDSVELVLYMSKTSAGDQTISLYRLLADWGESSSNASGGEGAGGTAATGDATWIHTFYDTEFWQNPGGDFSPSSSAGITVGGIGSYTWSSTPDMIGDVQDWLDTPSSNFGWLLQGNESTNQTAKRFDTKENPVSANRPVLTVYYSPQTAIGDENSDLPYNFNLSQNYPNPFNPSTKISFSIPFKSTVQLEIFDITGRKVTTLLNNELSAGRHSIDFNAADLTSGIYFYKLKAGKFTAARKMYLVK
jgi:hypothetical protein